VPPDGVYRITGRHDGRDYRGLVSIGTNPTFAGTTRTVEAWLLDFRGSLYGEELSLRDFRYVRAQARFANVEALLEQMRADAATVRFPSFT
jgi:riboflavin kinase/FMN adenylyltransferase